MSLIVNIEKKLNSFSLKVNMKQDCGILAMLGASGSGKSMTLKCIAGIEKPERGYIELDGNVLFDSEKKICLAPQKRRVGYLFQQYALFPNMTVRKNIACGLQNADHGRNTTGKEERITQIIRQMRLEGLEDKYPFQISGGEQQRTALARILVNDPDALLLDEPFSALDSHLRFRMERDLRETLRQFDKPVLFVSHDRDEVYRLADRIAVLKEGRMESAGTKQEVFKDPGTVDAARMTGCKNISRIREAGRGRIFAEDWGISLQVDRPAEGKKYAGIRMHDLQILMTDHIGGKETDASEPSMFSDRRTDFAAAEQEAVSRRENRFLCRITEEIENPFSCTVMVCPLEAGADCVPIGIELDKKSWQCIKSTGKEIVTVCFPPENILLLQ